MRTLRYTIAAGVLVGLGACSNMMGGGSQAPKPVTTTQPTLAPDMVRQVQSKLRDGGYYKQGPVDGVWGPGTEAAVRSFQHDHNLGSSGQLDVPTLQALNVAGGPQATNTSAPGPDTGPATSTGSATTGSATTGSATTGYTTTGPTTTAPTQPMSTGPAAPPATSQPR